MSVIATDNKVAHLYKVSDVITGKYYVGKHNGSTQGYYWGSGKKWKDYIKKHGKDNLKYKILVLGTPEYVLELEKQYVTHEYIKENPNCFNLIQGGYGIGRMPQDIVDRIAEKLRGRPTWNKGIPMSEETKKKLSESKKGQIPPNKGKPMSEEAKRKLSASRKGCISTMRGISKSEEQKAKISASLKEWYKNKNAKKELI